MNPYILLGLVLAWGASIGGAFFYGRDTGKDSVLAGQTLIEEVEKRAREGAAEAIAQIEVKNITIRQKAEVITREIPVYRDCRHDPDAVRLLNDALAAPGQVAPDRELPGADTAR